MKQTMLSAATILCLVLAACSGQNNSDAQKATKQSPLNNSSNTMKNLISIVEIPTDSFARAVNFYQSILDVKINTIDMQGTPMGLFPSDERTVNVALVNGTDYKPSDQGTLVYFNGGENLQTVLDKIEPNGGKVIVPKTLIDPENGFFAMFTDSEGNKMGLHSYK
jgi:predicted enzyme related to lactoylglutathione lyase